MANDFVLGSEGYCFICLNKILTECSTQVKSEELEARAVAVKPCSSQSFHSLQYLSRYLKLDMRKVFDEVVPISPDLLAKVKNSKLKVELCQECSSLNGAFLKLYRKLERIQMEVTSCVDLVRGKLVKAKEFGKLTNIRKQALEGSLHKNETSPVRVEALDGKLRIIESLREEAIQKCSYKSSPSVIPRVKVYKMTIKQVAKEKLKIRTSSRRTSVSNNRKERICETTQNRDVELGELKMETSMSTPDLRLPPDNDNDNDYHNTYYEADDDDHDDNMQSDDDVTANKMVDDETDHNESATATNATVTDSTTLLSSNMAVDESHRSLNPETGKHRCLLCSKEFVQMKTFEGHYQGVHLKVKYKCTLCGMEFSYSQSYRRHHRTVHKGERFKCPDCNLDFSRGYLLTQHQQKMGCLSGSKS